MTILLTTTYATRKFDQLFLWRNRKKKKVCLLDLKSSHVSSGIVSLVTCTAEFWYVRLRLVL